MNKLVLAVLVVSAGCAVQTPPEPVTGPQGEVGPAGPQGVKGDIGLTGPQGPSGLSGIAISRIDGGVSLKDSDGGAAVVYDGPQGVQGQKGDTGAQGIQGPQGPIGLHAYNLSVWDGDGGVVGLVFPDWNSKYNTVFIEATACAVQLDLPTGTIVPVQTMVYFSQPNCTGSSWIDSNIIMFPIGCYAVSTQTYRVTQPVTAAPATAASVADPAGPTLPDGGTSVRCRNGSFPVNGGMVVERVTLPNISGPFTFGTR